MIISLIHILGCSKKDEIFRGIHFGTLILDSSQVSVNILASDLEVPWDLELGPNNKLWFTQQKGTVSTLDLNTGKVTELVKIPDVHYQKSRGLLSMVLHPDFESDPYAYLHYNYLKIDDKDTLIESRLVRYILNKKDHRLDYDQTILNEIPGQTYHNGSRMIISHDRKILLTIGDAGKKMNSQDPNSLSGKLLSINLDGTFPADNPYPKSYVYVIGLRNSQGLAYGKNAILYGSDHGPNNDDEINILSKGKNYGWPLVEGYCNTTAERRICLEEDITEPLHVWTPTVAVAGLAYYGHNKIPEWENSLLAATLKAQSLVTLRLDETGSEVIEQKVYLQGVLGRIRDVVVSPEGDIFLSTSNHDWHPKSQPWMYDSFPTPQDDRIIKLSVTDNQSSKASDSKNVFFEVEAVKEFPSANGQVSNSMSGESIYEINCANCHMQNGQGIPSLIPPLAGTDWVTGNRNKLISSVLEGISGEIIVNGKKYNQEMPGFKSQLSDAEIAKVLTFIRNNFGNQAAEIRAAEVAELRK